MFLFEKYVSLWPNRIIWEYMECNQFTHMAFISYKREDEKWAKWLQQKLESYRLPVAIRKEHQDLPERLSPIFRDTTDFSGGVLADAITNGLKASRHLIVICSPRAANSKWVCKEVEDFRNLGKSAQIIPFIIEGEAHSKDPDKECFPKSLLELSDSEEVLGININENGREAAFVKVVATMLGLEFDALWQRHQRAERRRRRMVMGGLMGFILMLLGVAGWISWQYVELNKRNNLIETQNREIDMKNDSILRVNQVLADANRTIQLANDSIERAYNKLSVSEHNLMLKNFELEEANNRIQREQKSTYIALAKAVAEKARMMVAQGDALQAMMALLEVMPDNLDNPNRPYVAEADAALRIVLDSVYSAKGLMQYTISEDIGNAFFSIDDKYIYSFSDNNFKGNDTMFVSDAETYNVLGYSAIPDTCELYESVDTKQFAIKTKERLDLYSLPYMKGIESIAVYANPDKVRTILGKMHPLAVVDNPFVGYETEEVGDRFSSGYNIFTFTDKKSNQPLFSFKEEMPDDYWESGVTISPDGCRIAVIDRNQNNIRVMDKNGKKIIESAPDYFPHWSTNLEYSKSGNVLFLIDNRNKMLNLLDANTLETIGRISTYPYDAYSYVYSNADDNKFLVTTEFERVLRIYTRNTSPRYLALEQNLRDNLADLLAKSNNHPAESDDDSVFVHGDYEFYLGDGIVSFHDKKARYKDWNIRDNTIAYLFKKICYDKYIIVRCVHDHGWIRNKVLELTSGVCVCDNVNIDVGDDGEEGTPYLFPSYPDLIKQCKDIVKGMKLTPSVRKKYFLE